MGGMREMAKTDVPRVYELISSYLKKFPLHPEFTQDELAHWMLPREGVIYSFVREHSGPRQVFASQSRVFVLERCHFRAIVRSHVRRLNFGTAARLRCVQRSERHGTRLVFEGFEIWHR